MKLRVFLQPAPRVHATAYILLKRLNTFWSQVRQLAQAIS